MEPNRFSFTAQLWLVRSKSVAPAPLETVSRAGGGARRAPETIHVPRSLPDAVASTRASRNPMLGVSVELSTLKRGCVLANQD